MREGYIRFAVEEGVCRIQFDRPEKLNAVNPDVLKEFEDALISYKQNEQTRVVVLHGNEKAFVAGADVGNMAQSVVKETFEANRPHNACPGEAGRAARTPFIRRGLNTSLKDGLEIEQALLCYAIRHPRSGERPGRVLREAQTLFPWEVKHRPTRKG